MAAFDVVVAAVEAVTGPSTNGSWRCPGHEDHNPSLAISNGNKGVVLHCHAGCEVSSVLAAIGLDMSDLFDKPKEKTDGKRRIVATYPYVNKDGELRYEVVRYEPKDFRQRRPNPNGEGTWVWNLQGVKKVLYRLPEVLHAVEDGRTIFVVEGEKDADALVRAGEVATTCPGGAGKWKPQYTDSLRGAEEVVVVADADDAGRKHAEEVADAIEPVVGIVTRAEPKVGKDMAEHLGAAKPDEVVVLGDGDLHEHQPDHQDEHGGDEELHGLTREDISRYVEACRAAGIRPEDLTGGLDAVGVHDDAVEVRETGELLADVEAVLTRFVIFPNPATATAVALWVLFTHVADECHVSPYLEVTSATKRAGKSRLFEVLKLLCARAWLLSSVSEAALFRKIDRDHPTLLLDEVDAMFGKDSAQTEGIRGILDAGYSKGAVVSRCIGQGHDVEDFTVYGPKAFAGIGRKLPDTVMDRCIPVHLRRRAKSEPKPQRFRLRQEVERMAPLRAELRAWGGAHAQTIGQAIVELPELGDREADIWEPLVVIGDLAGIDARPIAIELHGQQEDDDRGVQLLHHIREAFDESRQERLPTESILRHLVNRGDESPWARWWERELEHGDIRAPASRLASYLTPFGIHSKKLRVGNLTPRGFERIDFEDAWNRYPV